MTGKTYILDLKKWSPVTPVAEVSVKHLSVSVFVRGDRSCAEEFFLQH